METYTAWPASVVNADGRPTPLLAKWQRICEIRDLVNKEIETVRTTGAVGSSLQANVTLTVPSEDHALLASLGDDLKFVFITSAIELIAGNSIQISVEASKAKMRTLLALP
jgi:isoleucyl-tRNA synthetase